MNHRSPSSPISPSHPTGATLVEVLMSLLIMAFGVTSVFLLFPLAIQKALKANQLTNAKLYEGSIKDTLLSNSQLWTGAPEWAENTIYGRKQFTDNIQDLWVAPRPNGRLLPNTNQIYYCIENAPESSGSTPPSFFVQRNWAATLFGGGYQNRPTGKASAFDGALVWTPYRHSPYLGDTTWSAYIVDPLGWHRALTAVDRQLFGRIQSGDTTSAAYHLDRIHCQLSSDTADQFFRLQDSWSEAVELTPVTVSIPLANRIQIQFPDTMDVTSQNALNRVVFTSTLSSNVVTIPVSGPTYPTTSSLVIDGTLPTGFQPDQARIDVQSPSRFSWLMAVHSGPYGEYNAQCAIVFNRTFEALDEQGYRAEFCQTEDLNGNGTLDPGEDSLWSNGRIDMNMAKVRWPSSTDLEGPKLKEGGYIFDAAFGYWYQIQKIEVDQEPVDAADAANSGGAYTRTIMKLSDQVVLSTGTDFSDYLVDGTNDSKAVIIPGVIHVFHENCESPR